MDYEYLLSKLQEIRKIPYPVIDVKEKNINLANRIYNDYSGKVSELTAITKYVYQNIGLEDRKLADIIGKIAMVEMHHLRILGTIINQLGRRPYYVYSDSFIPWNSNNVYYGIEDLYLVMKNDYIQEQEAINDYKLLLQYVKNENIIENIRRIIMDENVHKEIFEYVLEHIRTEKNK